MADKYKITRQEAFEYYGAYEHFFPEGQPKPNNTPYLRWTLKSFIEDIGKKTGIDIGITGDKTDINITPSQRTAINNSQKTLEALVTEGEATDVPKNLETLKAADEKREAARKVAMEAANEKVVKMIESQEKSYEKLKALKEQKEVFIKAEALKAEVISKVTQDKLHNLKNLSSIPDEAAQIKKSISASFPELSDQQLNLLSLDAAYKAVDAANNQAKYLETAKRAAILKAVATDNVVLRRVTADEEVLENIRIAASELGTFNDIQTQNVRKIWAAFDPELAKILFPDPTDFQISLSETQLPGYTATFNPAGMMQGYVGFLNNNLSFFGKLTGLPIEELQHEMLLRASSWLESQITANFPQMAGLISSPESQLFLRSLGIGTTTVDLSGSFAQFFIENPGSLPVLNFFGNSLGINFSAGSIAGTMTAETAVLAGGEAVGVAGTAGVETAVVTGAVAAAPATFGTSLIVAAAVVGQKVIKAATKVVKDNVQKYGKWVVAVVGGVFGVLIGGGVVGGTIGFGAGYFIASVIAGGLPGLGAAASTAGAFIGNIAGIIGTIFLGEIGAPLLSTVIGTTIMTAFVLFIINSGAFVVPPSPSALASVNPYIDITKTANPSGPFQNGGVPHTITYTLTITAKQAPLTDIVIKDDCNVTTKNGSFGCSAPNITTPTTIAVGSPFTFSYDMNNINYKDALVLNTITVTASTAVSKVQEVSATAALTIGNPPTNCPSGWPVAGSYMITQTPGGSFSHALVEAMDIATPMGRPVKSTSSGIVKVVYNNTAYRPVYVTVSSVCTGKQIEVWYAHLQSVAVKDGQQVVAGQLIGTTGTEGSGPHLHYEFRGGIKLVPPYIPRSIPTPCSDDHGKCGFLP